MSTPTTSNALIADVRRFISATWDATIRQPAQQSAAEVRLPGPFVVPTAEPLFHIFFYWDTYFACEGLLREGRVELARQQADNMVHLLETLGFVPNMAIHEHLNRSQPPLASALVAAVYRRTGDRTWLARAHAALGREYAFWQSMRLHANGLAHYGHHGSPQAVAEFYYVVRERLHDIPADPAARMVLLAHAMAEAESGWDFTPRFAGRAGAMAAIDLNALLYLHETNAAHFSAELDDGQAALWQARAARRRTLVDMHCWDAQRGAYFDYDTHTSQPAALLTSAAFVPLFAGMATPAQAAAMVARLPDLERAFGLVACAAGAQTSQTYQWDAPNMWPPTQFFTIAGLQRYGYTADARRLAAKYLAAVAQSFAATGNLWEKYNAETGGVDVVDEYTMPAMLGWTAGTFLFCHELLGLEDA